METKQKCAPVFNRSVRDSLSKMFTVLLVTILCISLAACKKKEVEEVQPPDPLATAAGSYMGNIEENGKVIPNIKANVTTALLSNGKLYITSIGFTSSTYQLVVSRSGSYLKVEKNGMTYQLGESVNGNVLNVSGKYSYVIGSPNYVQNTFSFTGTKQ